MGGVGNGLRIVWSGRGASVALVALWRHGSGRRLWDVGGVGWDRVLERRRAAVVGVVRHSRRIESEREEDVKERRACADSDWGATLGEQSEFGLGQL